MKILFDAGSLINLSNGQSLDRLASTNRYRGYVAPLVRAECKSIANELSGLIAAGTLIELPDLEMDLTEFSTLMAQTGLGVGEAECLAVCQNSDHVVSCDDGVARRVLAAALGDARVSGTLGLLIMAVRDGLLPEVEAFARYQQMRLRGGFLPPLTEEQFHALV